MIKRYIAIFTAIIFLFTIVPFTFVQRAYAYSNNSYFNDLKIGLVSMSSTTLTLTLNGDYTLNGQATPSGTILNLGTNGTSITLNGTAQSQITLAPSNIGNLLTITSGSVTNKYMGSFLFKIYNGKILPINTLDMENYLKGVVGYEMSDYYPLEALKAQAVAARNYALSRIGYEAAKGYDFDDTISYQVYKGFNSSYTKVLTAVDQTKGQVLLYNDKLVETLYSAWHGGISEDSENVWGNVIPYLRSVSDSFENDPWPNGNRVLTNAQIQSTLVSKSYLTSTDTFIKLDLASITNFPSGRVANINIIYKDATGTTKTKSVTKDSTRTFLSLPSNLYTVVYDATAGSYTFSGKGYGHGLGMSQIGAKNRAAAGQTFEQILKFYYQNTYLQNLILKASFATLTQSSTNLFAGDKISFTSTAASGNGYGYLFKYVIKNGSNTVLTQEYSTTATLDFSPSVAGNYTVDAYVKDKFSVSDYDDKKTASFTAYNAIALNSFTLDKQDVLVGQGVSSNIDVQGGSGNYLYKYEVSKNGVVTTTKDFASDKAFTYVPDQAGSYTVTSYVKDSASTKAYDFTQVQSFTAYAAPVITSLNKDKENIFIGDTANFSASVNGGSNKGLQYKFVISKDGQALFTRDFNSSNTVSYSPTAVGSYEITVYALDAISTASYDATSKITFAVSSKASITSLTADKTTAFLGDVITINATGNSSDTLYKYVVLKDGAATMTQDYSSNSSFLYTPSTAGNYEIQVFAKSTSSPLNYDDTKSLSVLVLDNAKLDTVVVNKTAYLAGQTLGLNAASTLGSGSYLYKYTIEKDGVLVSSMDFANQNSIQYKLDAAGSYSITVYMKDALSTKTFDDSKVLTITTYDQPTMTLTNSKDSGLMGSTFNYNISSNGGSQKTQNRFVVMKDTVVVTDSGYLDSSSFSFTPVTPGLFQVIGYLKDALSENSFDAQSTLNLNVYNPQITSVTANGTFYEGKAMSFTANSTGVSPSGFNYKYEIFNTNNTLVISNNFNSQNTFSFTPATAGSYIVKVYGKDGLSTQNYDSIKQFNLTINSKPLYLSTLPLKYGMTNNDVTSLQNALVKLGYTISDTTGYFGTKTKNAVMDFQKNKGLTVDGIVGNMTYGALNDALIEKAGTKNLTF